MRRGVIVLGVCAVAALGSLPRVASGDGPPTEDRIRFASDEHDRGAVAYSAGRYGEAAIHFENAFFNAPNSSVLRAAILARRKGKEFARAATLSALGQRKYPDDAATKQVASEAIAEARSHVQEVDIACAVECGVVADGKIVTIERAKDIRFFLDPGHHELTVAFSEDRVTTIPVDAVAGGAMEKKVDAPPPKPPPPTSATSSTSLVAPPPPSATIPDRDRLPPSRKPLGPAVFFTGLGLTVVGAGATVILGLNAQNNPGKDAVLRDCVGLGTSCDTYQRGLTAQRNTNIALAATGGVALVTLVIGVFFTQWGSPARASGAAGFVRPVVGVERGGSSVGVVGAF